MLENSVDDLYVFGEKKVVIKESLTNNALQGNWKTPTEFCCCPDCCGEDPIKNYYEKLTIGSVFAKNFFGSSVVLKVELSEDKKTIYVISKNQDKEALKPFGLASIVYENNKFLHKSLGLYFEEKTTEQLLCEEQGFEWEGEESWEMGCL